MIFLLYAYTVCQARFLREPNMQETIAAIAGVGASGRQALGRAPAGCGLTEGGFQSRKSTNPRERGAVGGLVVLALHGRRVSANALTLAVKGA